MPSRSFDIETLRFHCQALGEQVGMRENYPYLDRLSCAVLLLKHLTESGHYMFGVSIFCEDAIIQHSLSCLIMALEYNVINNI